MSMLEKFRKFIIEKHLINPDQITLLAVSGGMDSVVMTSLFHSAGLRFAIAHCNFGLRWEESEWDNQFVQELAMKYEVPFYVTKFNTEQFAVDNKLSIQEAARKLRYSWFSEIIKEHGFKAVAVAHHQDDITETMLINLIRGSGIHGLHGIAALKGDVIRPMLFTNREEIAAYAEAQKLSWREDASNAEEYYTRNKIRLSVLPMLREINPAVDNNLLKFSHIISKTEQMLEDHIRGISERLLQPLPGERGWSISLSLLSEYQGDEVLLYELLKPFGFDSATCSDIFKSIQHGQSGAQFESDSFRLVRDRSTLTITPFTNTGNYFEQKIDLSVNGELMTPTGKLSWNILELPADLKSLRDIPGFGNRHMFIADASDLEGNWLVRSWKQGDAFHPFGMRGRKLLSDYFTEEKFSSFDKEVVLLLVRDHEIAWVINHRQDDRYRIYPDSRKAISFSYQIQ